MSGCNGLPWTDDEAGAADVRRRFRRVIARKDIAAGRDYRVLPVSEKPKVGVVRTLGMEGEMILGAYVPVLVYVSAAELLASERRASAQGGGDE